FRDDILKSFPRVGIPRLIQEDAIHRSSKAYDCWGLTVNGKPAALMDVSGMVHFLDETFMEVGRTDPSDAMLAMRHASEILRVLSL
ncbi:MAG: hypothetical protein DMF79_09835, partial [Acidobacteria bacterium]